MSSTLSTKQLPRRMRTAVERETRGESIRWIGRPSARRTFVLATAAWLMGVPWCALMFPMFGGMLLSFLSGKPTGRAIPAWEVVIGVGMAIFIGAFALIGLAMLLAPFAAWWKARRVVHVITDRRLITISAGRSTEVKSFRPRELFAIARRERKDGSGTLSVITSWTRDSDGDRLTQTEQLISVPQVAQAEQLLRDLQARAKPDVHDR